jgi:hypothetical protein
MVQSFFSTMMELIRRDLPQQTKGLTVGIIVSEDEEGRLTAKDIRDNLTYSDLEPLPPDYPQIFVDDRVLIGFTTEHPSSAIIIRKLRVLQGDE